MTHCNTIRLSFSFLFVVTFTLNSFGQQNKIDSLTRELENTKDDTSKVNALNAISRQLWQTSHFDEAKKYAEKALILSTSMRLAGEEGWLRGEVNAHNNLAIIYSNQGNYAEAQKNLSAALKNKTKIGDKNGIGALYQNLGIMFFYLGNYTEALKNYFEALKTYEETGDKHGIGNSYSNIAVVYSRQNNIPEALKSFKSALAIQLEIGNKLGAAALYNNIGANYIEMKNYTEAKKNYSASLVIQEEIGDKKGTAYCYGNLGIVYQEEGNYREAQKYYFVSLKIKEEVGDKKGISVSCGNIGSLYIKQNNYAPAVEYLERGVALAKEIGSKDDMKDQYLYLSEAYAGMSNYKKALEYHKLSSEYKDSILNDENSRQTAQMKTKYETEKKDNEIALLNSEKQIRQAELENEKFTKRAWAAGGSGFALLSVLAFILYRTNQTKKENELNLQLSEIKIELADVNMKAHEQMNEHFIFNSMQSIQHFINANDSESAEKYLIKFSNLTRRILENSRKQEITVQEEVDALKLYMDLEALRLPDGFDYEIVIGKSVDAQNTLIPPLILQPFVENAIKHGLQPMRSRGKITITIQRIGNELECIVEDNGLGRKAEKSALEISSPAKRESLGMKITDERIKLYNRIKNANAFFRIEDLFNVDNKAAGVRVLLHLPLELEN